MMVCLRRLPFNWKMYIPGFWCPCFFVPTNHLCTTCYSVIDQSILGWVAKSAFLTHCLMVWLEWTSSEWFPRNSNDSKEDYCHEKISWTSYTIRSWQLLNIDYLRRLITQKHHTKNQLSIPQQLQQTIPTNVITLLIHHFPILLGPLNPRIGRPQIRTWPHKTKAACKAELLHTLPLPDVQCHFVWIFIFLAFVQCQTKGIFCWCFWNVIVFTLEIHGSCYCWTPRNTWSTQVFSWRSELICHPNIIFVRRHLINSSP